MIIVDNIAKYYAVDLDTGELLWAKRNSAPFNSQVKLYKDKFFVIDFQNILRCFSVNDGKELWNVKTDDTFIKSQKKLSLAISNKTIFFNNSVGDISAVDIESERLIWQTPTQSSSIYENAFLLETSDLVIENDSIYFSNNRNEFYSLDSKTGGINWVQKINSNVRPTVIDNFVFTVTIEGFLVIIEKNSGNIIRITDIFEKIKNKKRESVNPVGFVVGLNNIYLTTNNGLFIVVDIFSGKTSSITKIGNKKILRPFVVDDKIIITKNNAIIRFK